jgi:hypothetical protein
MTKSLSAIGSRSMPSLVTCFDLRARYPSIRSVKDAIAKSAAPSNGFSEATRIKGRIITILLNVIIIGKLRLSKRLP